MNKTNIEWTDYTWNPVPGCEHGCPYCYARPMAHRFYPPEIGFKPHFWPERLDEPMRLLKPSKIFVTSMGDLFGKWVPDEWIEAVLETVEACPQHTFQFLTKNPERMIGRWPDNCWMGATATDQAMFDKASWFLSFIPNNAVKFISCEPLLGPIRLTNKWGYEHLNWIIIGAMTGPKAVKPKEIWIWRLIEDAAEHNIPVFAKANLGKFYSKWQAWPVPKDDGIVRRAYR